MKPGTEGSNRQEQSSDFPGVRGGSAQGQMRHEPGRPGRRASGNTTGPSKRPGGYRWGVGLHYVGEVAEGSRSRMLMDYTPAASPGIRSWPFKIGSFIPSYSVSQREWRTTAPRSSMSSRSNQKQFTSISTTSKASCSLQRVISSPDACRSCWIDYGLPPAKSAFATHALIVNHYLEGAWYLQGGAGVIAEGAQKSDLARRRQSVCQS